MCCCCRCCLLFPALLLNQAEHSARLQIADRIRQERIARRAARVGLTPDQYEVRAGAAGAAEALQILQAIQRTDETLDTICTLRRQQHATATMNKGCFEMLWGYISQIFPVRWVSETVDVPRRVYLQFGAILAKPWWRHVPDSMKVQKGFGFLKGSIRSTGSALPRLHLDLHISSFFKL
jgi:hypothetical protein